MTAIALQSEPLVTDMTLCAENPSEMIMAQSKLILWCESKMALEDGNRVEALGNAARAKVSGWAGEEARWKRVAGRARMKTEFYDKIKLALQAGYYIVPPFPTQVFAIRTKRTYLKGCTKDGHFNDHEQKEQTLPAGQGEYQNPFPQVWKHEDTRTLTDGTKKTSRWTTADKFLAMDFPFGLAKPEILEAASAAMARKVFDRLSVAPRYRAPDPIVIGEINVPHRPGTTVSFFVAWWLDTKTL